LSTPRAAIGYALVGAEPGPLVRDLPAGPVAPDPLLAAAVKTTVAASELAPIEAARSALADLGVGFVSLNGASSGPLAIALDATSGITRLGNNNGLILWRVLPRGNAVSSSRLRLQDGAGAPLASVPVTGDHGQTDVSLGPEPAGVSASGRELVVAEPSQWAAHARVTYAGRPLAVIAGAAQPTFLLPATAGHLSITVEPTRHWWNWARLGLLVVVLFLAAPFGSTRRRSAP
jgi:hypothetical protein